jgi:uncharacterized RDD family membrane protein YckC
MSEPFQPSPGGPSGPRAGFWRRLGAVLIDGLIIAVVAGGLMGIGVAADIVALAVIGYVLWVIGPIVYDIYFHGSASGQTPGKRLLGIRVIDFATGGPIGYGRATIRWLSKILSSIPCFLGYLWMLWDKEKQTWHDKLANDVVVPTSAYPVQR